jgi:hypothetical protein
MRKGRLIILGSASNISQTSAAAMTYPSDEVARHEGHRVSMIMDSRGHLQGIRQCM